MTELRPGGRLLDGRYELERLLGAGGMASVWLAQDRRLARPVAVKVISDTLAADRDYVRRFEREARIAAGLSHPSLVRVYDYAAGGDRPMLVMEYVAGGTLADVLPERSGEVDALRLARELLGALGHIHDAGIVHRDVKPANVLLGRDGRARLTDFGIARAAGQTKLTQTGQVVGTMRYLAPEVLAGEPATPRSDLYALGVILTECASRDAAAGALAGRLTAPEPAQRPASAQEALRQLDGSASPTAATAVMRPRRARRRRGVLAGLAALLAAGAVALAAVSGGTPDGDGTVRQADVDAQVERLQRVVRRAAER
jgi:eukaryotic-like serine/threonine-protein kinase